MITYLARPRIQELQDVRRCPLSARVTVKQASQHAEESHDIEGHGRFCGVVAYARVLPEGRFCVNVDFSCAEIDDRAEKELKLFSFIANCTKGV